jgi:hypothetical protein
VVAEGRLEPKDLFDEGRHLGRLGAQLVLQEGALGQQPDRVADQARRGLRSRADEDHQRERGFLSRQAAVPDARSGGAEHIALGR